MTQASPVDQTTGNILTFDDSITVPAPVSDVYRRWNDFPSFPSFMSNVQEVKPLGGNRYHWIARIFGIKQEWDAEVTENVPNQRISWRSTSGPYNAGTVSFTPDGSGQTSVRLRLEYAPPGGKVGQALDQLTQTTKREVSEDLRNFKHLITGQPTNQGIAGTATQAMQGMQQGIQQGVQQFQQQAPGGLGSVLGPLTVPIGASVAGGVASYIIGKRLRESRAYAMYTNPVALPNAIAGWALTGASAASVLGSATGAGWPSRTPDWASPPASSEPNGSADTRPRNCTSAPSRAIVRAALYGPPPRLARTPPAGSTIRSIRLSPATRIMPARMTARSAPGSPAVPQDPS